MYAPSGKYHCIDLFGLQTGNNKYVGIWPCNGGPNQKWLYDPSTQYLRSAMDNSKCLTVYNNVAANKTPFVIYDCNVNSTPPQANSQRFTYDSSLQHWQVMGRCLEVYLGNTGSMSLSDLPAAAPPGYPTNTGLLETWDCGTIAKPSPNQKFVNSN
jgi:hypothetical protein